MDQAPWLAWDNEVLDVLASVADQLSLALDSAGHPHIAYVGDDSLKYAYFNGLFWEVTTLRAIGNTPSIAVDSEDRPHISYYTGSSVPEPWKGNLNHTYFDGANWLFETVDATGFVGANSHIALDASDRPQILYRDFSNTDLKYAYQDDAGWQIEIIDGGTPLAADDLALDAAGVSHVVYAGQFAQLRYATRNGGAWSSQQVAPTGGGEASIDIDSLGRPHIAYGASGVLRYASLEGGVWMIETADAQQDTGLDPSLDIDAEDGAHVAHRQTVDPFNPGDPTRGHLKYAAKSASGTWSTEIVDPTTATFGTSLEVDDDGRPRIAYGIRHRPLGVTRQVAFDLGYAEPVSAAAISLSP